VNISALLFVKNAQRTDAGELNLIGALWETINLRPTDPADGGCRLALFMQTDDPAESNDFTVEIKAWRDGIDAPTVHETSFALDPTLTGRNRATVVTVPGAFFREPGDYVVTAAPEGERATAYVRIEVVAADLVEAASDESADEGGAQSMSAGSPLLAWSRG
jgi:hypothetical protein